VAALLTLFSHHNKSLERKYFKFVKAVLWCYSAARAITRLRAKLREKKERNEGKKKLLRKDKENANLNV